MMGLRRKEPASRGNSLCKGRQSLTLERAWHVLETKRSLVWQEAKWAEMRWVPPTSSISSWVFHLPPASQRSCQACVGMGPYQLLDSIWAWSLAPAKGQVTDDIDSYFCLSPAVSIFAA